MDKLSFMPLSQVRIHCSDFDETHKCSTALCDIYIEFHKMHQEIREVQYKLIYALT
jgi:hypothetical protein